MSAARWAIVDATRTSTARSKRARIFPMEPDTVHLPDLFESFLHRLSRDLRREALRQVSGGSAADLCGAAGVVVHLAHEACGDDRVGLGPRGVGRVRPAVLSDLDRFPRNEEGRL